MRWYLVVFWMGAAAAAGALISGCGATYSWGPQGRSVSVDVRPDLIEPGIGLLERHWADER